MKFTKIIISLMSVCIFFSSCYVVRMPEENSELYEININKNRIFIRYLKPNAGASDRYSVAEIDKDGKVLKIFE